MACLLGYRSYPPHWPTQVISVHLTTVVNFFTTIVQLSLPQYLFLIGTVVWHEIQL